MKITLLAVMAKLLGIQFHVDGLPYGANYQRRDDSFSHSAHCDLIEAHSPESLPTKMVSFPSM